MGSLRRSSVGVAVLLLAAGGCAAPDEPDAGQGAPPTATRSEDPDGGAPGGGEPGGGGENPVDSAPPTATSGPPDTSAEPSATEGATPDDRMAAFVRDCEQSLDARSWQPGQVSYPRTMALEVGQEETYDVAVDVRSVPPPPEDVIDAADPTSEPVLVRCVLSARLVAVGDHLSVTTDDQDNVIDGWSYQTFTPSGTVEWAWTVTADAPEPGGLRLVLRPAAVASDVLSARVTSEQRYETDVEVTGSLLAQAAHWVDTEFPFLKTVAVALGGVLLGLMVWFGGVRSRWRDFRATPAAGGPSAGGTPATAPVPRPPPPRRNAGKRRRKDRSPR